MDALLHTGAVAQRQRQADVQPLAGRESTEEILRRRLASGEISSEEYEHIRGMLRD